MAELAVRCDCGWEARGPEDELVKKIQQQQNDLKSMIDLLYGKWETLSGEKEELESGALA